MAVLAPAGLVVICAGFGRWPGAAWLRRPFAAPWCAAAGQLRRSVVALAAILRFVLVPLG